MLTDTFAPAKAVAVDATVLYELPRTKFQRLRDSVMRRPLKLNPRGAALCAAVARSFHVFLLTDNKDDFKRLLFDTQDSVYLPLLVPDFAHLRELARKEDIAVCFSNLFMDTHTLGDRMVQRYSTMEDLVAMIGADVVYSFGTEAKQ